MITASKRRAQGAERARRYRAKQRGDGEIALTRRPSKNAPEPGEAYSAWADRTLRLTAGPRRGDTWQTYEWQKEPLDVCGAGGRIVVLRARRSPVRVLSAWRSRARGSKPATRC